MLHDWLARATSLGRRSIGITEITLKVEGLGARVAELSNSVAQLSVTLDSVRQNTEWVPHNTYLGDHTALVQTRWGAMLLIDSRESVLGPALLLYGLWEPEITEWFQLNVKPSQVVVDVGANVGYYSLLAANLVGPEGRVVAVEAHPRMAELLFRNSIINGRPNITALNKAAWHQTERLTFHMRRHFAANSSVGAMEGSNLAKLDDFEDNVEVEAVRLDDVLAGFEHVDLIKIDVEGAELQVFMGLTETMASHPGIRVLFEWSPGQQKMLGTDPQAILDLLRTQGFALRHVEGGLCSISDEALLQLHHGNVLAER